MSPQVSNDVSCSGENCVSIRRASSFVSNDKENYLSPPLRYRPKLQSPSAFRNIETNDEAHDSQNEARIIDIEIDSLLDKIATGVNRLEDGCNFIKFELVGQQGDLDSLNSRIGHEERKIESTRGKTAKIMFLVEKDKLCMYSFCFLTLTAVACALLYVLGLFRR